MQDRDPSAPPSSREVAGEDFLFHLYRGSELLQDNRVHDAKAELEQALRFQPSDPKGQDLLGIVYFRLGLYPRAIAIYEALVQTHPDAIEPRVNLALSYLKTGQAQSARFELERVVEQNPHHSRAWGYLGLAFQRLGDYERASHAFAAGGHDVMARRLLDMAMQSSPNATVTATASLLPDPSSRESRRPPSFDARASASIRPGIEVIRDPVPSLSRPPPPPEAPPGTWTPIEQDVSARSPSPPPVIDAPPPIERTPPAPPVQMVPPPAALPTTASLGATTIAPPSSRAALSERPRATAPQLVSQAFREALLVFPRALPVAHHPSGLVLVQAAQGFAVRLDVVRSMTLGAAAGDPLPRRVRGRVVDEPLGGAASPLIAMPPKSELCLSAPEDQRLLVLSLADEPLYLREDALAGLDPDVTYENGRLPVGDGEAIPMVQLKGPGSVVASVPEPCHAVEVMEGRNLTLRAAHVIAWTGRLLPRALLASEAPAGVKHLCAFTGEGMVLLDGRR